MYNNDCTISYKILSHELTIRKQRNFALLHFRRYQGGVCNDASSSEPVQGQKLTLKVWEIAHVNFETTMVFMNNIR